MLPFAGAANPLVPSDLDSVAAQIGCDTRSLHAVMTVETGGAGGFLSDGSGRPRILFEAAVFSVLTAHRFDASHPHISVPVADWTLYRGGAAEYDRLAEAVALDRDAALQATSWGMFQVMGEHYKMFLFNTPSDMVLAMAHSEGAQLMAFGLYCMRVEGCAAALRDRDWDTFAVLYNGPLYAKNRYPQKLAAAYADTAVAPSVLRIGSRGPDVVHMQIALTGHGQPCDADGVFGRVTELAVMHYQAAHNLISDGVVGMATAYSLGLC